MNGATEKSLFARLRMPLFTLAVVLAYAAFIEWFWGWSVIIAGWQHAGISVVIIAMVLLTATYIIRAWRMHDYFPRQTKGRFLALFRVTQVHNLLNIMMPFRTGETSFPLLMRSEFGIPLARGTSALLVLRLLDLHALLVAAGIGLALESDKPVLAWGLWAIVLVAPLILFALKRPIIGFTRRALPAKLEALIEEVDAGTPATMAAFIRAWAFTVVNWSTKVVVLAWVLALMGVTPIAAAFGGALGGELSSVLPVHAPGGIGTYPAGIAAGAAALGADASDVLGTLAKAAINVHLLVVVSALAGTALSLVLPGSGKSRYTDDRR